MIIIELKGGIGNQMFQYAFGRSISIETNVELVLDNYYFKNKLGTTPRLYELNKFPKVKGRLIKMEDLFLINKKQNKIISLIKHLFSLKIIIFKEKKFNYSTIEKSKENFYFSGYWQSYKYFEKISEIIKSDFFYDINDLNNENSNWLKKIQETNSVSVHIRRGDFLKHSELYRYSSNSVL